MASSPLVVLAIVSLTLTFEAMIAGSEIAAASFPEFEALDDGTCDEGVQCEDGFFAGLKRIGNYIGNFFQIIWGVLVFFTKLMTFDVGGTPWPIRVPLSTLLIGSTVWSLATLFRGN